MAISDVAGFLDGELDPASAIDDPDKHVACLPYRETFRKLGILGVPFELLETLILQTAELLPSLSDPSRAINNLERFFLASRSPLALACLFQRDKTGLPILLKIFANSQYLADILISDPESYDALRLFAGQPIARATLIREICDEVVKAHSAMAAMRILRQFKRRETLRIAYGDIVAQQDISTVTQQISYLADGICQAALIFAEKLLQPKYQWPMVDDHRCKFVIFSLGKLGGNELNYSSDIDLVMIYEANGETSGDRKISNKEYFQRLASETIKLISETTELGSAYRVDMRLRPDGLQGQLVITADSALTYYDMKGRNWERQAFIKARPTAGDYEFGKHWIQQLKTWIYPSRLTHTDIAGIQTLRRKIERQSGTGRSLQNQQRNVKTGAGGIRDIEFVVQFMQLLHGRHFPVLQTTNTLEALRRLVEINLLTSLEQRILDQNYRWLRRLEHRLQILFDLQTHVIPDDKKEIVRLALRMGYGSQTQADNHAVALQEFEDQWDRVTKSNRRILDHLLQQAFRSDDSGKTNDEIDLILDPFPEATFIETVLSKYGFDDYNLAYQHLSGLANEDVSFLPQARCRHFLASIAKPLLEEIAKTPEPLQTLIALNRVSQHLGGKAILWELFSSNLPIMHLFVRMCAACRYLCDLLVSHPGMIDGVLDSLLLQDLPTRKFLLSMLRELTHNANDIDLIVHAFKASQHLHIGIRDINDRDPISDTLAALSDVAETCLRSITEFEMNIFVQRYGRPTCKQESIVRHCEFVVLALGKLGGREPNYHSDLDLMFLYESSGDTLHENPDKQISNQEFFSRLAAAITKRITSLGPHGRLFDIDSRLRPTGKSGALAVSFGEFARYFAGGGGQLWERQALCKARAITGSSAARRAVRRLIGNAILAEPWKPQFAMEIRDMRLKWQDGASAKNLKRGPGGTVDVEFTIQMLQLKFANAFPTVLVPGTLAAAHKLHEAGVLNVDHWHLFSTAYRRFRLIESRLRLMDLPKMHDLPHDDTDLRKLSYLLGTTQQALEDEVQSLQTKVRNAFEQIFAAEQLPHS
ncbi:MAG TPA: bifunctional [glutamate--ammonia ligase]-adenylyl-L-tyrosine phosphorylase/[glutamate--ammonia-ligase] adenylyltransferase [Pirellulaceae bacterium]|nr:bifunctional [glutamate--ammonia ligase]-adenylyl-L-tyrosine phosphorylase/[glutamate--ammonia-ligase] adenylyltransferase [Pirellulaceae bacterium]HMO91188.1 bifunctional [glutamate--ammonia ligase]-adenylyl-L-tyrosine phosphorylase/[glutamate--ammonia-ligase] adenylyltransferase [Pirellulaceae bacterium]HMP69042.1 bifunctional [glutamate--ammonia ligase]-adenylyl-L-tyrosine phosphorylase/[glutamate--ammonia-ligase] adenylyltransferase [Pirellulaceae bacterium]